LISSAVASAICSRNAHRRFDLSSHLVHRVRAQHDALGTCPFHRARRVGQSFAGILPASRTLQLLDVVKVDAVKDQLGRVKPAQSPLDRLVDEAVVQRGRFPAHAADQADHLHTDPSAFPAGSFSCCTGLH
jgi:hypothetical protein